MYGVSRLIASSPVHDATRAVASLAIERSIEGTLHKLLRGGDRGDAVAMHSSDHSRRIHFQAKERSCIPCPQRFVSLVAVQHVVLRCAFADRFFDRETDHHQADALFAE